MMQYIRERATSKFAKFLFLGIGISFLGFGGSGFMSSLGDSNVAKVNGEKISNQALTIAYNNYVQNQGGVLPEGTDVRAVKQQILNGLIQEQVLLQTAQKMNVTVSNDELRQTILGMSFLHDGNGEFSKDLYQYYLKQQGLTPEQWEENLRLQLTKQLLINAIAQSVIVTDSDLAELAKINREKRDLSIVNIPLSRFESDVAVSDEMIASYYEFNKSHFMTDPRVKIAYVTLPKVDVDAVSVSHEEIADRVQDMLKKRAANETRVSDQLIIQFNNDAEKEAALVKLQDIYQGLESDSLTYDDAKAQITALSDGLFYETGIVKRNEQDVLDQALFQLTEDDIYSKPIVYTNSVHLIRLLKVNQAEQETPDDLNAMAEADLRKEKEDKLNADNIQKFQEVAERNSQSLELLAQTFDVQPVETDWLSLKSKEGVLEDSNMFQAVTEEMVLTSGQNTEAFETADHQIIIARVEDYADTRPLTLAEARDDIHKILVKQGAIKKAEALVEDMNNALKMEDTTLNEVVSAHGLIVKDYDAVETRNLIEKAQQQPEAIQGLIYGFQATVTEEPILQVFPEEDALTAVLIRNITPGVLSDYSADELKKLREDSKSNIANTETVLFMQGLYDQSKIEVFSTPFMNE